MFGIELDIIKKIEIGFCVVVLLLAGYFIYSGTRKPVDSTVTAWVETHRIAKNDRQPISESNPEDPVRSFTITIFSLSNHDGQLEVKEYPKRSIVNPEDHSKAEINFHHAPKDDKDTYQVFPPMMRIIIGNKDPVHRAIAMATVCFLYHNQNPKLFNRLALNPADYKTASTKFNDLREALALIDTDVSNGTIETPQYNNVMAALHAVRGSGSIDFKANPKQAEDAKKFVDLAIPFAKIVQDRKLARIDQYVDEMIPLLSDSQKKTAVTIGEEVLTTYQNMQRAGAGRRIVAK